MSSSAKTEKPSEKKKQNESKRGRSWRSQDLVVLITLLGGACFIRFGISAMAVFDSMLRAAENGFVTPLHDYTKNFVELFIVAIAGFILLVIVLAAIPNLLMSRFRFATEAIRLNFSAISPVSGFKRIFNLKTIKDAAKACLYLAVFAMAMGMFWRTHRTEILSLSRLPSIGLLPTLGDLVFSLVLTLLVAALTIVLADAFLEYQLYIRELKMTREEVKRENKDENGAPEIKREQRRLGREMLSGDVLADVEKSTFIVANPTHIGIGLYINPEIAPLPFISVMETDERALAVIQHAKKMKIPVVRNISLARKIFSTHRRYSFVSEDCLNDIAEILMWFVELEKNQRDQYDAEDIEVAPPDAEDAKDLSTSQMTAR
ncbi:EscU/YscU/HrcU family type III secretion system export apparatus switch protein [Ralstonia mojiangensis]|uniref:EscU/YscU/HrcU family type III secretion system export apparatus switch protein n=1 Tax=Ralstonia mojiangensis TaxID=2953895 RepID=UPI0021B2E4A4|nr:EscU/YscU/HrcU family type III secretion system export apparatus switch protein [Ralstonia mojiangensis]MCT7328823.1 EscU/YscU/HrcU family type III secretion system export apparatus switch protein [Ralstonia mojiangensis]